jgi:hypothetical protein
MVLRICFLWIFTDFFRKSCQKNKSSLLKSNFKTRLQLVRHQQLPRTAFKNELRNNRNLKSGGRKNGSDYFRAKHEFFRNYVRNVKRVESGLNYYGYVSYDFDWSSLLSYFAKTRIFEKSKSLWIKRRLCRISLKRHKSCDFLWITRKRIQKLQFIFRTFR